VKRISDPGSMVTGIDGDTIVLEDNKTRVDTYEMPRKDCVAIKKQLII
jgi:hypothetical protein